MQIHKRAESESYLHARMLKEEVQALYSPAPTRSVPLKASKTDKVILFETQQSLQSLHDQPEESSSVNLNQHVSWELLRHLKVDEDHMVQRLGRRPRSGEHKDEESMHPRGRTQLEMESLALTIRLQQEQEADRLRRQIEEEKSILLANHLAESSRAENDNHEHQSIALALRLQQREESELRIQRSKLEAQEKEAIRLAKKLQEEEEEKESLSLKLAVELTQREQAELKAQQLQWETKEQESLRVATKMHREEQSKISEGESYMTKEKILKNLEPCQLSALLYVESKAQFMHDLALPALEQRVESLGYNEDALHRCLQYIRNDAPIIIHLTELTLSKLVTDTHYRSLFETGTSGGSTKLSARRKWEDAMFGSSYEECEPHMRPKYGCLNITGDIAGVHPARYYGSLYITLASHVRHRATFFDKDTGGKAKAKSLATNELYAHVLNNYTDEDLRSALNVSRIGGAPSYCKTYKEVQIHGPICLASDIQALSVPGKAAYASDFLKSNVMMFQKITGCNVLWQGDLLGY